MDDQGDLGGWALAENVQAKFFVLLNEIINYFKCLLEFKIELGVPLIRFKNFEKINKFRLIYVSVQLMSQR